MIGRNLDAVSSLAADADGNVYLLNNSRLVRISADWVQRSVATNLTGLTFNGRRYPRTGFAPVATG